MHRRSAAVVIGVVLASTLAGCAQPAAVTPGPTAPEPSITASPSATVRPSRSAAAPSPSAGTASPGALAASWTMLAVSGGPSAREDHTWTADASGDVAYLFGGRDGTTVHGDVWAYDLAADAWTELVVGGGPAPRFGHEAVWADGIGLVIFAGQAGPAFFNDLWAFDPDAGTWTELDASGAIPRERYGSCAAIGPDGRLWISHGFTSDGTRFADTVAYDFGTATWTDETPDGDLPVSRCLHGCWWTDDGSLALYAGQTTGATALGDRWILDAGRWSRVEGAVPPDRNLYARARLPGGTLVVGGQALDGSFLSDAWLLPDDSADAHEVSVTGPALPGVAGAELVADPARDRVLLFGGRDASGAFADAWELSGDLEGP